MVKRNAPSATRIAALNSPPLSGFISLIASEPFSPSLTRLPSESLMRAREPAPVFTSSPPLSSMPTESGRRTLLFPMRRSTQAGICTPSTTAAACAIASWEKTASTALNKTALRRFIENPPL